MERTFAGPLPPAGTATVREVVPDIPPNVAVIVVVPAPTEAASPFAPCVLLMVATAVAEEPHVTSVVRFCVVLSEKVPVAVNCWLVPLAMEAVAGVTAIETSVGGGAELPPPQPATSMINGIRSRILFN